MKALTLWQPWSWAVAHAGKRVENRTWPAPRGAVGELIAIHAGKKLDEDAALDLGVRLMGREPDVPESFVQGAVESVARLVAVGRHDEERGRLSTVGDCEAALRECRSFWFTGPFGWVLSGVVVLPEPVPCRGAQGLWTLPKDVESRVAAQIEEVSRG